MVLRSKEAFSISDLNNDYKLYLVIYLIKFRLILAWFLNLNKEIIKI